MVLINIDLDIIIPCYNAKETLFNTLSSIRIQKETPKFKVYLINDRSEYDYSEEVNFFSKYFNIEEILLDSNQGPGVARAEGIIRSNSPYIMFIDSDDILYDNISIKELYNAVQGYDMCISNFILERDGVRVVKEKNKVWLHGKIYKRDFLNKYNINFNNTRANEDNGFNKLILLLNPKINYLDKITYIYKENEKSITRSNNRNYKISGLEGFCINAKWAIEESIKRGADKIVAPYLATSSLISLYYDYLYTRNEPNNKDILKYSKILLPFYLDNEKVPNDFIRYCFTYKEKELEKENKEYIKDITFEDFINEVINNG